MLLAVFWQIVTVVIGEEHPGQRGDEIELPSVHMATDDNVGVARQRLVACDDRRYTRIVNKHNTRRCLINTFA